MKKLFFFALGACISFALNAQKSPIKYGDIPMEDMTMKVYDKDSSAAAVILTDYGVSYISVNLGQIKLTLEKHTRIKILKNDGFSYADVSVMLRTNGGSEEKVMNLKASSYNLEGGKIIETKISKEGIFREKINEYRTRQKFTIPNVKVGSVIEYTYRFTSDFWVSFPNWQFQYNIPSRWSEYWAMIPEVFVYQKYMQGYLQTSVNEKKRMGYYGEDVDAYHWISKDIPAFKEEPYMTTEDDFVSKINFALSYIKYDTHEEEIMGTWVKLNKNLLESATFGKVIEGGGFLKDKVQELTAGIDDPLKKIAVISDYVKTNVVYNDNEDYTSDPLKKVLEKKKGSAGDINLLLASMLDKAGFETDMVLLSTRDHGFIRTPYPMTSQFNYVICKVKVGDKTLLLDATEPFLPYDVLPERCLNETGLVISEKNHGWIDIVPKAKSKTIVSGDFVLNAEGDLKGNIQYIRDGYDAEAMRRAYKSKGEQKYVEDFTKSKTWKFEKSQFKDVEDLSKPARVTYDISIAEHTSVAGDVIYINPFVASQIEENPFKLETRTYPINYGSLTEKTYLCKIKIPEGYVVDELPKSKIFALPGNTGRYVYNMTILGDLISINSTFSINKALFVQEEYPNLREFYNQVVAKQAEQIVLKKK